MGVIFETCPVCGRFEQVTLVERWRELVDVGATIPIVGCGNPWHYFGLDAE